MLAGWLVRVNHGGESRSIASALGAPDGEVDTPGSSATRPAAAGHAWAPRWTITTPEELPMLARLLRRVASSGRAALQALRHRLLAVTKPAAPPLVAGTLADLLRSKPELVAENALLR